MRCRLYWLHNTTSTLTGRRVQVQRISDWASHENRTQTHKAGY